MSLQTLPGAVPRRYRAPRTALRPGLFFARLGMCFAEARPPVQFIFMLRLLAGVALAAPLGVKIAMPRLIAVAVLWELAIFSVYLFDGVTDIVEDRLNSSARPIARGDLPPGFAATVSLAAAATAAAGAFLLGPLYCGLVVAILALGYAYCVPPARLKRWSGAAGATVIVAGMLTFVAGASMGGSFRPTPALIIFALIMSLWMGLVGAIAKDFSDIEGDVVAGCRTAALRCYARAARLVTGSAVSLGAGFAAVSFLVAPVLVGPSAVLVAGAAGVVWVVRAAPPQSSRARRRRPYHAFMITQYAVHGSVLICLIARHS